MRDFNPKSKFRTAVIVRDSPGQATDVMYTYCTACHIVRLSCRDVSLAAQQVQQKADFTGSSGRDGHNARTRLHSSPFSGPLLRDDLRHAYDRLAWSWY